MTALTELTLSHFRSHKRTTVQPGAASVALHGPNGAVKTNILEAISMLSPGRGLRRAGAQDLVRRPESLGWKVAGVLDMGHQTHELETRAEPGQPRTVTIDGKASPQTALGRLFRVLWLVPAMDRLWTEGADGRRRFLDRMTLSFDPGHAEATLAYEKSMRDRNRLLKDQVRDAGWYDALEQQMAKAGAKIDRARRITIDRLRAAQAGAETVFPTAELDLLSDAQLSDEDAFRTMLAEGRVEDLRAGRTLVGPHRADLAAVFALKGVAASQCSTGEQKALLISLVLANARALTEDTGAAPVLLLDEVAAHLDADRRAALYDEIHHLGAQAWMTGTGPELFEALGDRALSLSVSEVGGLSDLSP